MKFVEMNNIRAGMKLARPLYNKKGVLLVERGAKLTNQNIESVKSFGLFGMYVLEPAEPLPPMTEEDLEYERFQITTGFAIQEELDKILATGKQSGIPALASMIIGNYGYSDKKINFYQNLRSIDDYVSRHVLNVAILCTLITRAMNIRREEQFQIVQAALLHDLGQCRLQKSYQQAGRTIKEMERAEVAEQLQTLDVLERAFADYDSIKRICAQALRAQADVDKEGKILMSGKMVEGARILMVANRFDELTAVDFQGKAESEVKAILEFRKYPECYDKRVVNALIKTVNILVPGVSVVLNTGEKALVLTENRDDILKPTVLTFRDNSIINLALHDNQYISIVDVMKTMDNRYVMKKDIRLQENSNETDVNNEQP